MEVHQVHEVVVVVEVVMKEEDEVFFAAQLQDTAV
jgi:hypothetical protein